MFEDMEYKYVAIYLETLKETDPEIKGTPQTIADFGETACLLDTQKP